jgi:thioredoxin
MAEKSRIKHLKNQQELVDKNSIVKFTATWCGPCKKIAPVYSELAEKYTKIYFYEVDVDKQEDIAEEFGVNSMPTFIFFSRGKMQEKFSGADADKLREIVELFAKNKK